MMTYAGTALAIVLIPFFVYAVISAIGRKSGTAQPLGPGASHVYYGATLIDDGYAYYPDWCAMMLREFDESIDSRLEQYFDVAKSIAEQPRDQWISLAQSFGTD